MRFRFEDRNLARLYTEPGFRLPAVGPDLVRQFRKKMQLIDAANDERDLYALRGLRLEKLVGNREGQHSIRLNDQFRLILRFTKDDDGRVVVVIEITDYR